MTRTELEAKGLVWKFNSGKYYIYQNNTLISVVRFLDMRCGSIEEYITREIKWGHIKVGE